MDYKSLDKDIYSKINSQNKTNLYTLILLHSQGGIPPDSISHIYDYSIVEYLLKLTEYSQLYMDHALQVASTEYKLPVVKLLLENGANINRIHDNAMSSSVIHNNYSMVKFLIDKGYNINKDSDRFILLACENGHLPIVELLYNHGANIHNPRVLPLAAKGGNLDIVKFLLNPPMKANGRPTERGVPITPDAMQHAYHYQQKHILDYLISKGGDPTKLKKQWLL